MERLTHLIDRSTQFGEWKAARASRYGPEISSLAFADDLILFREAIKEQVFIMKRCLDEFCNASGRRLVWINLSFISPLTLILILEMRCVVLWLWKQPTTLGDILGVPTINGHTSKADYQFLLDTINNKLAGWKAKCISMAGRVTLA